VRDDGGGGEGRVTEEEIRMAEDTYVCQHGDTFPVGKLCTCTDDASLSEGDEEWEATDRYEDGHNDGYVDACLDVRAGKLTPELVEREARWV